ncbi:cation:proton antiporter [Synechocystis sp. FACHB-383]|uniref:cation:proton antiporter domain-containing protein n=2 Tax=unclassified Synechocystis TaxID=2640012 RepID=UPI00168464B1|nr:cation:proton antiporter [Synechocystis sp. FACHB-383]MBD2652106.1 cation:proton antiporter [Synechocystis sp. FACHB-383]
MDGLFAPIPSNPLIDFTILLLVTLILPPIFERLKLPGLVGLLFAGIVLGKSGLGILDQDSESIKLFTDIGKIYLMFVAGLEIDMVDFRRTRNRSLLYGCLTFAIPLLTGLAVGQLFGYSLNASVLMGSLFASHTLLGYPIVQRLGIVRNQAVMVTIGATIFTDIAALLVLAICISIHSGSFSPAGLVVQLVAIAGYSALVLVGFDWAGKEYFRRTGDEQSNQFLFVLLAVFLASVGSELINVDKIVGAFLAGLAVNDVLGKGPVKEKVEFLGTTLFIPFFFIGIGLLLDLPAFMVTLTTLFPLVVAIVGGLIISKGVAAILAQLKLGYTWAEGLTMWSLSIPQVAATLAAAVAGYQAINASGDRLVSETVLNTIIVLMLITSIIGPLMTAKFATKIPPPNSLSNLEDDSALPGENGEITLVPPKASTFTVLVPTQNPQTLSYLLEMGALIARHESGVVIPLAIAKAPVHMDDPGLNRRLTRNELLLQQATELATTLKVDAHPALRIDDDVARAISHTAREKNADLIIMGWSQQSLGLRAKLFGSTIDSVFWSAHCPVAVMRLLSDPHSFHRILFPIKNLTPQTLELFQFTQRLAETNGAIVTLLHVCPHNTSPQQVQAFKTEMERFLDQCQATAEYPIKVICHDDAAKVLVRVSHTFDLVVLRSFRRRSVGGVALGEVTDKILREITSSFVLFGDPYA